MPLVAQGIFYFSKQDSDITSRAKLEGNAKKIAIDTFHQF